MKTLTPLSPLLTSTHVKAKFGGERGKKSVHEWEMGVGGGRLPGQQPHHGDSSESCCCFLLPCHLPPPSSSSCQLSMALQCICTIQIGFAGGGKREWKGWERKIWQRHQIWIYKSRNVIEKKKNVVMRILQAAYACIMRETEVQYNKMRGAGVNV